MTNAFMFLLSDILIILIFFTTFFMIHFDYMYVNSFLIIIAVSYQYKMHQIMNYDKEKKYKKQWKNRNIGVHIEKKSVEMVPVFVWSIWSTEIFLICFYFHTDSKKNSENVSFWLWKIIKKFIQNYHSIMISSQKWNIH